MYCLVWSVLLDGHPLHVFDRSPRELRRSGRVHDHRGGLRGQQHWRPLRDDRGLRGDDEKGRAANVGACDSDRLFVDNRSPGGQGDFTDLYCRVNPWVTLELGARTAPYCTALFMITYLSPYHTFITA